MWSPELIPEKTILLAGSAECADHDHLVAGILESGPVTYDEPGFRWRTLPDHHGLFVWVGMIEIEDDMFFFDGAWENPTTQDLWHMAGLDITEIAGECATA